MASTDRKLLDIFAYIDQLNLEASRAKSSSDKIENYNKGLVLIREAKELIGVLQKEIVDMDTEILTETTRSKMDQVENWIDMLSMPGMQVHELLGIVSELKSISAGIPTTALVHENIEQAVVYDEQDIEF